MLDGQRARRKDIRKEEVKRELVYTLTLATSILCCT